ncbi:hypothetical protein [Leifsonia sp. 21MFCrub1.1]|uniref:hypothetical protein n=1 Tax=Leifsonia sp. 21MFCrub1.1 TaxID=1798223 RepID=UPI000892862E|nr:hypothetical protein [Leifsonia sp. 21MFCrub1.1]SEA98747.1 hypothetical protein SAMN04515680_2488 [Leifsonia sp. 21MFCrub1.1]
MRNSIRMAWIGGAAVVALGLGTAAAVAATGGTGGDDRLHSVHQSGTPSPVLDDRIQRPTPSDPPTAVSVPAPDDHGADDPAAHDLGDDHGADDPATHDVGDDHGSGGHGADDPAGHDAGDDHGSGGHGADD